MTERRKYALTLAMIAAAAATYYAVAERASERAKPAAPPSPTDTLAPPR